MKPLTEILDNLMTWQLKAEDSKDGLTPEEAKAKVTTAASPDNKPSKTSQNALSNPPNNDKEEI